MKNLDDQLMLKELASVIARLEAVLTGLKNPEAPSTLIDEPATSGLLSQWQKLFYASRATSDNSVHYAAHLSDEFEQQLLRLQNSHHKLTRLYQHRHDKLREAASTLYESGACPTQGQELCHAIQQGGASHQEQLGKLLDLYQTALDILITEDKQHEAQQLQLCSRLQQLVQELHFSGPVGQELTKIRRQLLHTLPREELPKLCVRLIDLTIEGIRYERKNTKQFLAKLDTRLENAHHYAKHTHDDGHTLYEAHRQQSGHISHELSNIEQHLAGQQDKKLLATIAQHTNNIKQILSHNEHLVANEQRLVSRMAEMAKQIADIKKEANHFQQQLHAQNDKLFIDSLTQIYNRAGMDQRLELEYRQWLRDGHPLCIALLDIDYFKGINDKYGHLAGDKALRMIARTLQKTLRESDFVARFGGEEFTVLLKNIDRDNLDTPLQKLREQVKSIPFRFKEQAVTITISVGATLFLTGDSINSAFERADQALYQAKHAGRDQIVIN
ncbi:GGDEF domain-containing protein [Oceanisphaera avium]|uniref:diguanylate cyclase n=1 Tax=Oceanisphaera avium TaxID=1903694 RepID=A0A1Y0CWB9_9GAMM|nr:GGDEF domain-containing protein [Oceanisphaera avium]ART79643.1 hypothetical protein CBP12_05320 [Oceanisphaera avium]